MSGKKSNDQAIQGRRLRLVYDALDSGQNKKAIQEADKVLKKHSGLLAAKALKALALIRTEKGTEAFPIIMALETIVRENAEYDENLIQALCHCYRESFMPERIATIYDFLAKKNPGDENIMSQLFLAYVRIGNYKEQQRVAMQLFKEFNMTPYLMWSIMSVIMQGISNSKLGPTMFYPLAEKMMDKAISQAYTFKGEEVDLFLFLLELRGKTKEAISYVENNPDFHENMLEGTKNYHYLNRLYLLSNEFDTLIERSVRCLDRNLNDWTAWQFLFDAYFRSIDQAAIENDSFDNLRPKFKKLINTCWEFLEKSKAIDEPGVRRGPLIACLEMINRFRKNRHITDDQLDALLDTQSTTTYMKQLIEYSHTKPYCFNDVKLYLHLLQLSDYDELINYTSSLAPPKCNDEDTDMKKELAMVASDWNDILREELVMAKISHEKKDSNDNIERENRVRRLLGRLPAKHFQAGQIASMYGSLIAGHLLESSKPSENMFAMIIVLEHIRRTYVDCDRSVLILLCRLYAIFGEVGRVGALCRQLDIKYVQRDSLGFMQFFLAERFGRFRTAVIFYTSISAQYDQSEREVSECCVNAYKSGAFSQIVKLADFQRKCIYSVYSAATDIMNRALSSIFSVESLDLAGSTIFGDDAETEWNQLCDNRDFCIVSGTTCDCCMEQMNIIKRKSFEEIVTALKLQNAFCQTIGILSKKNVSLAEFKKKFEIYKNQLKIAQDFNKEVEDRKLPLGNFSLLNMATALEGGYHRVPIFIFDVISAIFERLEMENNENEISADKFPPVDELVAILNNVIVSKLPDNTKEIFLFDFIEFLKHSALSLQNIVSSLLALKFLERLLTGNTVNHGNATEKTAKNSGPKNSSEQKNLRESNILSLLSVYVGELAEALKKVRAALSSRLSSLDAEVTLMKDKKLDASKPENIIRFPDFNIDMLVKNSDNEGDKTMRKSLFELRNEIELSMKSSYIECIQETLGALLRADTKLLGSQS